MVVRMGKFGQHIHAEANRPPPEPHRPPLQKNRRVNRFKAIHGQHHLETPVNRRKMYGGGPSPSSPPLLLPSVLSYPPFLPPLSPPPQLHSLIPSCPCVRYPC